MTKTDDIVLQLERTLDSYIKSFFPFEYDNETYHLMDIYFASPWRRCDLCGNHWVYEVSVIKSDSGKLMHIGTMCLDGITNRDTTRWVKNFRSKIENIRNNRKLIDALALLLSAYREDELSLRIEKEDLRTVEECYMHMCNGYNLSGNQEQLVLDYINRFLIA